MEFNLIWVTAKQSQYIYQVLAKKGTSDTKSVYKNTISCIKIKKYFLQMICNIIQVLLYFMDFLSVKIDKFFKNVMGQLYNLWDSKLVYVCSYRCSKTIYSRHTIMRHPQLQHNSIFFWLNKKNIRFFFTIFSKLSKFYFCG